MLKSSSAGGCLGVPLRVGLSAASPRYAVGFPLQSLTWVKGLSLSCTCTLAHGLFRPGVRFRPLRQAAWPKPDIGAEGQTEHIRPCRHTGLRLFAETSRAPSRLKDFPGFCPAAGSSPCSHILLPPVSPCLGKRAFPALRKASFSCTRQVTYH